MQARSTHLHCHTISPSPGTNMLIYLSHNCTFPYIIGLINNGFNLRLLRASSSDWLHFDQHGVQELKVAAHGSNMKRTIPTLRALSF
jgi:hypothetical protein